MILLFLFLLLHPASTSHVRDHVVSSYHQAVLEVASNPFTSEEDLQIRNLSIAASTAVKLTRILGPEGHLPAEFCPRTTSECDFTRFRSHDGRCTDISNSLAGAKFSPFSRRFRPRYADGFGFPDLTYFLNSGLSKISQSVPVGVVAALLPDRVVESKVSKYLIDFAEFVYRDLVETTTFADSLTCCNGPSDECIQQNEMECVQRTAAAPYRNCSLGPREQMNLATAFLDAEQLFEKSKQIDFDGNLIEKVLLGELQFLLGRVKELRPTVKKETQFQLAREILIAEYQKITINEYLPLVIGENAMTKFGLSEGSHWLDNVDVNTLNEFVLAGKFYNNLKLNEELFPRHDDGKNKWSIVWKDRDHGMARYSNWLMDCEEYEIKNIQDLNQVLDAITVENLARVYRKVDDIDLSFGFNEKKAYGSLLGPTFRCIAAHQFQKTKHGDSRWYEKIFSTHQRKELEKVSLGGLICRNLKLGRIQKNPLLSEDNYPNYPINCNSTQFGTVDVEKWLSEEKFDESSSIYDSILDVCIDEVGRGRRKRSEDYVLSSTTLHSYSRMMLAKDEAVVEANVSLILLQATKKLHKEHGISLKELQGAKFGVELLDSLKQKCNPKPLPCDPTYPYRSNTGWCNNLVTPSTGVVFTELTRLLKPAYDDGIETPRLRSTSGRPLPSPREVSNEVHKAAKVESAKYTHFLMEFGQFIDHDITHSPVDQNLDGTALNCSRCDSSQTVSSSCFPISVPYNDKFFKSTPQSPACLSFVRSLPAQKTLGYRNQMNQVTSYLDGSVIYGSTTCEEDRLRTYKDGGMRVSHLTSRHGVIPPPSDETEQDGCLSSPSHPCFITGDDRNSQQTLLVSVQSLFLREHQRISRILAEKNVRWTDERVFQETRKLVSAEFTHIVYNEYLPKIIGQSAMDTLDLRPQNTGYYQGYDTTCDASILQPFATAAFRFGHSTATRFTPILDSPFAKTRNFVDIGSELLNMTKMYPVENILIGMMSKKQMETDRHVDDSLRNFLFSPNGRKGTGLDLIAINIQRGRDHGIPGYNEYRKLCGLSPLSSFSFFDDIDSESLQAMSTVYNSVDDVDLFTGIVSEVKMPGAIVGPTAGCIIGEQFKRLKKCDRFYYENNMEHTKFTTAQLDSIRKVSLASLICANTNVDVVTKDVFSVTDSLSNPFISCSNFNHVELNHWVEHEFCKIDEIKIPLHESRRTSPCRSCSCTSDGIICTSQKALNCNNLTSDRLAELKYSEPSCYLQCIR